MPLAGFARETFAGTVSWVGELYTNKRDDGKETHSISFGLRITIPTRQSDGTYDNSLYVERRVRVFGVQAQSVAKSLKFGINVIVVGDLTINPPHKAQDGTEYPQQEVINVYQSRGGVAVLCTFDDTVTSASHQKFLSEHPEFTQPRGKAQGNNTPSQPQAQSAPAPAQATAVQAQSSTLDFGNFDDAWQ